MTKEEWKEEMRGIGEKIAGIYGADYEDCEILSDGNIRFYCDDHGDGFYCDIAPQDLDTYR